MIPVHEPVSVRGGGEPTETRLFVPVDVKTQREEAGVLEGVYSNKTDVHIHNYMSESHMYPCWEVLILDSLPYFDPRVLTAKNVQFLQMKISIFFF